MTENENTAPIEQPQVEEAAPPQASITEPAEPATQPPVQDDKPAESGAHAVLTEIESGLEALAAFPENILKWLRDKLAEVRSHL